jgi:hypothetical protein
MGFLRLIKLIMEWYDLIGYAGLYKINKAGQVLSLRRNRLMTERIDNFGYKYVMLTKNKKQQFKNVHRLIALMFIQNPESKPQVNHVNGNKQDNSLLNLEWVTARENIVHGYKNGLLRQKKGVPRKRCSDGSTIPTG